MTQGRDQGPDELFHEGRISDFLQQHGLGRGPISAERIGEGQSNVTFRVRHGDADVVLRRGPKPPLPKSTHDMLREAKILSALGPADVPVPKVLATCADESLLGVPFYVMPFVHGEILTEREPARWGDLDVRRAVSEQLVDTLVALHAVPIDSEPLAAIGRPDGYLERQVRRFGALWEGNTRREVPLVAELAEWLARREPASQRFSVVHGDYRLGNLMFARRANELPTTALILDWEMAALGDPLADVGYMLATAAEAGAPESVMQLSPVTRLPGYLNRSELAERYASASGLDLSNVAWYQVLALWKAAIFCEAIYTRWLGGERPGDTSFAPKMDSGVPELLEQAHEITRSA